MQADNKENLENENREHQADRGISGRSHWRNTGSSILLGAVVALVPTLNKYLDNSKEVQLATIQLQNQVSDIKKQQDEGAVRGKTLIKATDDLKDEVADLKSQVKELSDQLNDCQHKCKVTK